MERWSARGEADFESAITDAAYDGAERFAKGAKKALLAGDMTNAKHLVRIALRYWGSRELSEAPEVLLEVGELGR